MSSDSRFQPARKRWGRRRGDLGRERLMRYGARPLLLYSEERTGTHGKSRSADPHQRGFGIRLLARRALERLSSQLARDRSILVLGMQLAARQSRRLRNCDAALGTFAAFSRDGMRSTGTIPRRLAHWALRVWTIVLLLGLSLLPSSARAIEVFDLLDHGGRILMVVGRLGNGAQSTAWLVRDLRSGEALALKVPSRPGTDYVTEHRAMSLVDHPGVPRSYGLVSVGDRSGLLMELSPGVTLMSLREVRSLSPVEAVGVGIQVSGALAQAHAAGLVHTDVWPNNVMFDPVRTTLIDWGNATTAVGGSVKGKLGIPWFPPEHRALGLHGRHLVTRDVYMTGVTMWSAMTSWDPPLSGLSSEALPDVRGGGTSLRGIIDRATHVDPSMRFPSAAALHNELVVLRKMGNWEVLGAKSPGAPLDGFDALFTAQLAYDELRPDDPLGLHGFRDGVPPGPVGDFFIRSTRSMFGYPSPAWLKWFRRVQGAPEEPKTSAETWVETSPLSDIWPLSDEAMSAMCARRVFGKPRRCF